MVNENQNVDRSVYSSFSNYNKRKREAMYSLDFSMVKILECVNDRLKFFLLPWKFSLQIRVIFFIFDSEDFRNGGFTRLLFHGEENT